MNSICGGCKYLYTDKCDLNNCPDNCSNKYEELFNDSDFIRMLNAHIVNNLEIKKTWYCDDPCLKVCFAQNLIEYVYL